MFLLVGFQNVEALLPGNSLVDLPHQSQRVKLLNLLCIDFAASPAPASLALSIDPASKLDAIICNIDPRNSCVAMFLLVGFQNFEALLPGNSLVDLPHQSQRVKLLNLLCIDFAAILALASISLSIDPASKLDAII
ncbi:unnamed protein product [Polarella glacialis]|uniref:Uncharacterized protein n=1 Tax=Polarella glacialis TaxID=89957 RepID=A0A813GZR5_POLGL|nr:unnamed protein product [Polarella glacialis]